MTHTVELVKDHKGFTGPKAIGDEYVVDALININPYTAGGETVLLSALGLDSVTAVTITGMEKPVGNAGYVVAIGNTATGGYHNNGDSTSITFLATDLDGTNAAAGTDDIGIIRIRAYGNK